MLIGHLADIHVGASKYGVDILKQDIDTMLRSSLEELAREHVRTIILAGDIFDKPRPTHSDLNELIKLLKQYTSKGFKFIAAIGEHDYPSTRDLTPLDLISTVLDGFYVPAGATAVRSGKPLLDLYVSIDNIRFQAVPFIKGYLEKRRETYKKMFRRLSSLPKNTVLIVHVGVQGYTHESDAIITPQDFPKVKYIALGHIHTRNIWRGQQGIPPHAYPGSLVPLTIEEARHTHNRGPLLIDLSGDDATIMEIPLELPRHYLIIESNIETLGESINKQLKGLKPREREPFIHLIVKASSPTVISKRHVENQIAKLEKHYNVKIRISEIIYTQPILSTTTTSIEHIDPAELERKILATKLAGNLELAKLVYDLKIALAQKSPHAEEIITMIFSDKYNSVWNQLLGKTPQQKILTITKQPALKKQEYTKKTKSRRTGLEEFLQ